jgi:hypothetical protein
LCNIRVGFRTGFVIKLFVDTKRVTVASRLSSRECLGNVEFEEERAVRTLSLLYLGVQLN